MWRRLEALVRRVVREELEAALVRDITVEVHRPTSGEPRIETKHMSVIDYMMVCSSHTEGALRGMQSDVNKACNALYMLPDQISQSLQLAYAQGERRGASIATETEEAGEQNEEDNYTCAVGVASSRSRSSR